MAFETRSTDEIVRIAMAGGGFRMDGSRRHVDDLVRIAMAGKSKRSRIVFTGLDSRTADDLVRIALAGGGCIQFE